MDLTRTVELTRDSSMPLPMMFRILLPCVILSFAPSVSLAAWQDWFRTPEQRAAQLLESGDANTLIDSAPSESWKGHGHFQAGELDAATASFEQARKMADESGNSAAVERELFNTATTNVHNGRLDEAINQFDELLELNPDHERASHNKEVAEKIRLQQQQQQQSGGDGEQGDENPDSESGDQQEGQPDNGQDGQQDGEQSDSGESGEQSADESSSQDDASERQEASADDSGTDPQQQQDGQDGHSDENSEEAARAALDAEQQLNGEQALADDTEEGDREEPVGIAARESDTPLTEQQQATEQWLRQIPDDPAGLLRNKLQQSHRLEYPGVQSSEERW